MSIKAMTWAFGLPLEPRAKIALLAIADNARDDGVAWPSKDTIAEKSSQSRATVQRKLKRLEQLGVLACFSRYREDGTQTSDEIRLNLAVTSDDVLLKMHESGESDDENNPETGSHEEIESNGSAGGGGYQPDTLPSHCSNPTVALLTGGGLHCGNPQDEPSLEPSKIPPNPPPGGSASKSDQVEAKQESEHFAAFFEGCQHWKTMDRARALTAFGFLTLEEQGRARAASLLHAEECAKAKRKSKDAHKLLGERFWERYPNARLPDKPREPVWISEADAKPLAIVYLILDRSPPKLIDDPAHGRGLWRLTPIEPDLAAIGRVIEVDVGEWPIVAADTKQFNAWRSRLHDWTGVWAEPRKRWLEPFDPKVHGLPSSHPDFRFRKAEYGLPVPIPWPPRKDGTLSPDAPSPTMTTDDIQVFANEGMR